ncbi:probable BolA-like protein 1 at C-terminar half [Coccomyxa sp. Obi]|nr:probable BolA-like protein 1 at C-terminar half [Coccomyxa sp. Obi]
MAYFSSFSHTCLHRSTFLNGSKYRSRALATVHAAAATSELPAELKKIVDLFNMVPDPKLKYQQLLAYGKKLPPMPAEDHTDDNKVRGCVSQVWVKPELRDGKVYWKADSDSVLTKGLAALLVQGLSGSTLEEVASLSPDWISEMGLQQSLTPSRNNGFLNMFALMRQKAAELSHEQQGKSESASAGPSSEEVDASKTNGSNAVKQSGSAPDGSTKPVRASMERKLTEALKPEALTILDESAQHAGHAGSRMLASPSGETHFKVSIVSSAFEGLNTVKRHRQVYEILKEELAGPVHALSLDTKSPQEVQ